MVSRLFLFKTSETIPLDPTTPTKSFCFNSSSSILILIATIGSGIALNRWPATAQRDYQESIVASNKHARDAIKTWAQEKGLTVRVDQETLYEDFEILAKKLAKSLLEGESGVYIWGGEPTVLLPKSPGVGGRNQSLALALAIHLQGTQGIRVLVAGTDGTDGPTEAAGGIIDGNVVDDSSLALDALQRADAGTFLQARNALFVTGPTGTNVMDLVIAIKA